jgi:hypothetical protein
MDELRDSEHQPELLQGEPITEETVAALVAAGIPEPDIRSFMDRGWRYDHKQGVFVSPPHPMSNVPKNES